MLWFLIRLRKTKAIDFGFSFGLPSASDEASQSASRPADVGISLGPPPAPSTATTAPTGLESSQPSIASPDRKLSSSQQGPIRRTPGSARNKLPPRPSPFDIPTEEPPEVGPSRKIRKLGAWLRKQEWIGLLTKLKIILGGHRQYHLAHGMK